MGIEPTALAWEARVLPLYDARLSDFEVTTLCRAHQAQLQCRILLNIPG